MNLVEAIQSNPRFRRPGDPGWYELDGTMLVYHEGETQRRAEITVEMAQACDFEIEAIAKAVTARDIREATQIIAKERAGIARPMSLGEYAKLLIEQLELE